jgi:hypothetical protein
LLWGGQSCPQPPFRRLFRAERESSEPHSRRLKAGGKDCFDLRGAIQRLEAEPLGPRNDWNENLIPT